MSIHKGYSFVVHLPGIFKPIQNTPCYLQCILRYDTNHYTVHTNVHFARIYEGLYSLYYNRYYLTETKCWNTEKRVKLTCNGAYSVVKRLACLRCLCLHRVSYRLTHRYLLCTLHTHSYTFSGHKCSSRYYCLVAYVL